jgi:glucan 1,3-beta-glucosidase
MASTSSKKTWIRGVNIGGWLLAERYITPYLFAVNTCQLNGDWCFYPGQLGAPPVTNKQEYGYCDLYHCQPHLVEDTFDYPTDEYTLLSSFPKKALAKEYMTFHWDNFVTKADVKALKEAGVTHVRVPVPHYMMGNILDDEPWVDGQWLFFVRFVGWARQYQIQVWLDLHTAPGSQNGFDNSGQLLPDAPTCEHWISSAQNIERTLQAIRDMSQAVMDDNLRDTVTGFGILNEPWADCDVTKLKKFNNDALVAVRDIMGEDTAIYIGDTFNASNWNNGWWVDEDIYSNTYMDSHYYNVFAERERALSPRQHVAYTCSKLARETASCCYTDHPKNTKVSKGISRIVGEWSVAYDVLPVEMLNDIMKNIRTNGEALLFDRELSEGRQEFLHNLCKAQMVTYESTDTGVSSGWFYWTLKMEGGAFAEWDFLRGVKENWIPKFPESGVDSKSVYGSCEEIAKQTKDDMSIVEEFPDPNERDTWLGPPIDDDFVVSHTTRSEEKNHDMTATTSSAVATSVNTTTAAPSGKDEPKWHWFRLLTLVLFAYGVWHVYLKDECKESKRSYFGALSVTFFSNSIFFFHRRVWSPT